MIYTGKCACGLWSVTVTTLTSLDQFNPRVCDCEFCQAHPSALISEPAMRIRVTGDAANFTRHQNGDRLATFHHCVGCGQLIVVARDFDGVLRGAVNAETLERKGELGPRVGIQPRLLSPDEKLARWKKLWGMVEGIWLSD